MKIFNIINPTLQGFIDRIMIELGFEDQNMIIFFIVSFAGLSRNCYILRNISTSYLIDYFIIKDLWVILSNC